MIMIDTQMCTTHSSFYIHKGKKKLIQIDFSYELSTTTLIKKSDLNNEGPYFCDLL